jgi:hypothetical protein
MDAAKGSTERGVPEGLKAWPSDRGQTYWDLQRGWAAELCRQEPGHPGRIESLDSTARAPQGRSAHRQVCTVLASAVRPKHHPTMGP